MTMTASKMGKRSWETRPNKYKTRKHMKKISKRGVEARAAKRSVDKTIIPMRSSGGDWRTPSTQVMIEREAVWS
jgi:hypothetical protein